MKNIFQGNANKPGVYKIINIQNNRMYFGSAKRFKERAYCHLKLLKNNKHFNKFLQNDFNKCGESVFEFHVVEVINGNQEKRLLIEQKYIDQYYDDQNQCYNFKKISKPTERSCSSKTPEETGKLISENMKRIWSDPEYKKKRVEKLKEIQKYRTKETYEKISKALTGKKLSPERIEKMRQVNLGKKNGPHTEEAKLKMSLNKTDRKPVKVTNLTSGKVRIFHSQAYAAKALNVSVQTISNIIRGISKASYKVKGYKIESMKS